MERLNSWFPPENWSPSEKDLKVEYISKAYKDWKFSEPLNINAPSFSLPCMKKMLKKFGGEGFTTICYKNGKFKTMKITRTNKNVLKIEDAKFFEL